MRGKNPQLAVNQYIIQGLERSKSLFRESELKKNFQKCGISDPEEQLRIIRNSKFFRQEPIQLEDIGFVWVLHKRNIVADCVINTQTAEVKTIDEALL